ncbi:MAG: hypothetical protein O7A04_05510 [Acidobacteria bacterium]|nr:hypothetical protein [Acidobacteriota bacterium]
MRRLRAVHRLDGDPQRAFMYVCQIRRLVVPKARPQGQHRGA